MMLAAVCKGEVKIYAYLPGESNANVCSIRSHFSPTFSQGTPTLIRSIEGAITNADGFSWNSNGNMCGLINSTGGVTVYDVVKNFAVSFDAPCSLKGIKAFYFSPLSTYLVTAERFEPKTPQTPNMSLWHVAGKARIVEGRLRKIAGKAWPSMKWTDDELCCCRVLSTEDSPNPAVRESHILQVLNSRTSKTDNIDIPGVSLVEMCPGKGSTKVSVFISGNGDRKPCIQVFDLGSVEKTPLLRHEFDHSIDTCAMKWNAQGTRILVQAGSEIDESGQSYYGTSKLFLAFVDTAVPSLKSIQHDAPVHDVQWSPTGSQFCLISGSTPFAVQLFDADGVCIHDLGKSRKNTVRFSTVKGRFLALGGFGNLAGELEFFDMPSKKSFSSTRSECTVECQWSPNGRVFMTSSTHPRMRVDNSITLFKYTGEKVSRLEFNELYSAKWRPMPKAEVPDTPASPRAFELASKQVEVVKKAYRPPSRTGLGDEQPKAVTTPRVTEEAPKVVTTTTPRDVLPPPPPPPPPVSPPKKQAVKMPCPEKEWFYKDPQEVVHGPYTKSVMSSWNKAGYFKEDLPIRAGSVLPFVPLNALFPVETVGGPFEAAMVVPQQWLNFK